MSKDVFCVHDRIDNENDYNEHDAIENSCYYIYHNDKYNVINVTPLDTTTCINTETYKNKQIYRGDCTDY